MQSLAIPTTTPPTTDNDGWQAALRLGFARTEQRTLLVQRQHVGPLQVQRPFYPEADGTCHIYLLHPPGGIVGGDQLSLNACLDKTTRVLLTTPAASKFYRSNGRIARQQQTLTLAEDALLEWLPQETIIYNGAQVINTTRVELSASSRFIGWEILCLGRPAASERFSEGQYWQRIELLRDGLPLFLEHNRYDNHSEVLNAVWGLQQQAVTATLLCTMQPSEQSQHLLESIRRQVVIDRRCELFSVSQLAEVLLCRYIGASSARAKALFTQIWSQIRLAEFAKPGCPPRIWNT